MNDLVDKAAAWDACDASFKKGLAKGRAEAADHIEVQYKLIEEMREMLERARNCVLNEGYYSFSDEIQDVISKSNPNTPERNDE